VHIVVTVSGGQALPPLQLCCCSDCVAAVVVVATCCCAASIVVVCIVVTNIHCLFCYCQFSSASSSWTSSSLLLLAPLCFIIWGHLHLYHLRCHCCSCSLAPHWSLLLGCVALMGCCSLSCAILVGAPVPFCVSILCSVFVVGGVALTVYSSTSAVLAAVLSCIDLNFFF